MRTPTQKITEADQFRARIFWQATAPLVGGRSYILRSTAAAGELETLVTVTALRAREDTATGELFPAKSIEAGETAITNISTEQPVQLYAGGEEANEFLLLDSLTRELVGRGEIAFALYRATNIKWQPLIINKQARAALKQQQPRCIWFTGLSGSGKSTLANLLEQHLHAQGCHTYLLDGDNVRHGLNRDLGFTEADRVENIRRVAEVARLMTDAGLIVLTAFISPFRAERRLARSRVGEGEFFEIFVDTPLQVAEERDPKGLYGKARRGELKNFTGVDSPYEAPEAPKLRIDTTTLSEDEAAERIVALLVERGLIGG